MLMRFALSMEDFGDLLSSLQHRPALQATINTPLLRRLLSDIRTMKTDEIHVVKERQKNGYTGPEVILVTRFSNNILQEEERYAGADAWDTFDASLLFNLHLEHHEAKLVVTDLPQFNEILKVIENRKRVE